MMFKAKNFFPHLIPQKIYEEHLCLHKILWKYFEKYEKLQCKLLFSLLYFSKKFLDFVKMSMFFINFCGK